MKKLPSVKAMMAIIAIMLVSILSVKKVSENKIINNVDTIMNNYMLVSNIDNIKLKNIVNNDLLATSKEIDLEVPEIVYDGMTLEQLAAKLEKNLKSTLKGYGMVFATYSIKYDVDPYLALAIVLHETGCSSGKCSTLINKCNNVGGMKGSPSCGNGSYKKFATLNDGIEAFFKNLANNYYKQGLTTPEKIGKKYAESTTWASRIKYYIQVIKNS